MRDKVRAAYLVYHICSYLNYKERPCGRSLFFAPKTKDESISTFALRPGSYYDYIPPIESISM